MSEALEFLNAILGEKSTHHLVAIWQGGEIEGRAFGFAERDAEERWLAERDRKANLYYHLNRLREAPASGKASRGDVEIIDFADVDMDPPSNITDLRSWRARIARKLDTLEHKPTFVVNSGNGVHAIWRLAEPLVVENGVEIERVERLNRALIAWFQAPSGTWSVDRIWRIAGTMNVPTPKKLEAGREATPTTVIKAYDTTHDIEGLEREFEAHKQDRQKEGSESSKSDTGSCESDAESSKSDTDGTGFSADFDTLWKQLPAYLRKRIEHPLLTSDRSAETHWIGMRMFELNFTINEVYVVLSNKSEPATSKFGGRLLREVERIHEKWMGKGAKRDERGGAEDGVGSDWNDLAGSEEKADSRSSGFIFDGDEQHRPQRDRIKGILPFLGPALIGGQSGAGKTTLIIDLIVAVASGQKFFGRDVRERCGVVFLAAEGAGGLVNRFASAKKGRGISFNDHLPIAYRGVAIDLRQDKHKEAIVKRLKEVDADFRRIYGVSLGLVIIDTMAASFAWEADPDGAEVTQACRTLAQFSEVLNALVMGVHHFGKDADKGFSGSHQWRANIDLGLGVICQRNETSGESSDRWLTVMKNRDGIEGPVDGFDMPFLELGIDGYGDDYGACIIVPLGIGPGCNGGDGRGDESAGTGFGSGGERLVNSVEVMNVVLDKHFRTARTVNPGDGKGNVLIVPVAAVKPDFVEEYRRRKEEGAKPESIDKQWRRQRDRVRDMDGIIEYQDRQWFWRPAG
ncbi:MAG: AAA family ATPase [Wenzhouxiangella sp.]